MIVDCMTKTTVQLGEGKRTSSSLKRIYNQLRQSYYHDNPEESVFMRKKPKEEKEKEKEKQKQKEVKRNSKLLPGILSREQTLNARSIQKYLTYKQFPLKKTDINDIQIINNHGSKLSNRQLKQILFPNRINNLKLSRYLSKRKSHEPINRDPDDIIITRKLELFPTQRAFTKSSVPADPVPGTPKKRSFLTPLKPTVRRSKTKCSMIEIPLSITFEDFTGLMRQYQYLTMKEQIPQYKAYVGKGNNSLLIKKLLKERGYWIVVDKWSQDVNFVWTQKKNTGLMRGMRRRELANESQRLEEINLGHTQNKDNDTKCQYSIIMKLLSKDMLSTITKSYKSSKRLTLFTLFNQIKAHRKSLRPQQFPSATALYMNHVENASSIGNKKGLLYHMSKYYRSLNKNPFDILPQSLHLVDRPSSISELKSKVTFGIPCILKPASGTNRGNGISIHTTWSSLNSAIQESAGSKSFVVQRYLPPFLYKGRKFDIRVWVLWVNGQAWWYTEGYLRTSSKEFSLKTTNRFVHLTNDAVQKKSQDYGKYESGNKLSFTEFQKYLSETHSSHNFLDAIQQMKTITKDVFRISSPLFDPNHKSFSYELFGLDFMIDQNFKVWLIQANTNPCLQTSCSLLNRLITNMLEGVLNLTLDVVFTPPARRKIRRDWSVEGFKFELIYDHYENWNDKREVDHTKFETDQDEFEEMDQQQ